MNTFIRVMYLFLSLEVTPVHASTVEATPVVSGVVSAVPLPAVTPTVPLLPSHADLVVRVQAQGAASYALADRIVTAAETHATETYSVALLLGLADVESDFDPTATSRLFGATWDAAKHRWTGGARATGSWRSTKRPMGSVGNYCCGITQATGTTWARCLALRDPDVAMQTLVASLDAWQKQGKTLRRALQGYGCGNAGMKGACKAYASKVLARSELFAQAPSDVPPSTPPSS